MLFLILSIGLSSQSYASSNEEGDYRPTHGVVRTFTENGYRVIYQEMTWSQDRIDYIQSLDGKITYEHGFLMNRNEDSVDGPETWVDWAPGLDGIPDRISADSNLPEWYLDTAALPEGNKNGITAEFTIGTANAKSLVANKLYWSEIIVEVGDDPDCKMDDSVSCESAQLIADLGHQHVDCDLPLISPPWCIDDDKHIWLNEELVNGKHWSIRIPGSYPWNNAGTSVPPITPDPGNESDTTSPTVSSFNVNISGATVSLGVSGVTDNQSGIKEVQYSAKWNNVWRDIGKTTQSPHALDWNMCDSAVPDGVVEFGLEVWDGAGNNYVWSQHHNNPTATKSFNCNPDGGNNPGGSAKLYALSNYGGATVWSGNTGFTNAPNADSYSFELPNGWSARSWRGDNRTGEERCWTGSVSNLQDHGWHLAIQSTEVFDHNVCGTNTSGDAVTMCADNGCWNFVVGYYSLPYWEMNDILTKITNVPSNLSVMLYREGGLRGTVECFNSPRDPLPSGGAYDLWKQVTDVVVFNGKNCPMTQQGAVIFYDEPNFGNYYWAAGNKPGIVNMADLGSRDLTNDKGQSMKIPPGKSAIISEHDGGQGLSSSCQTGDVPSLGTLGNQVSSVRIFDNTTCAPDAPTSLNVTGTTYHSISISWTHPEAANLHFKVYKWDGYNFVEFATVDQGVTTFTREGMECNVTDYYKVAALTSDGRESKPIGWVSATTESCPLPAEPQFVYFDKFTYEGESIFWWFNTPFAQDYNITAYGEVGEEYTSGWQTGTLWYAKDLRPDRVYLIKLIARNEAGQNENGLNFVWVKLAPPDIIGQTAKCDSVTLAWQNNSGYAQGFKVYRDEQIVVELGSDAVSFVDAAVTASSSYVYKVEVVGEHTYAASSSQLEYINTPACNTPQQPVAPQLVSPAQSAQFSVGQPITFQWLGGVADRYQLYVNQLTGGESRTIDLTETSYTIADLPPGSYQWFVSSITEAGQVGSSMGLFSVTENQTAFQLYLPLVTR